ncbi:LD-carboxypeptidase [Paraflavisolibacter sp. H34]|uniref:S66 peptidase family protein n=1 Tax=Huijunlia imazamoxiresistens TaxID=3127457 RepID=UPI003018CBF2
MITIPPYLQQGDTIGIVAPAGFMPFENMQTCIETLVSWGYNVRPGATANSSSANYFSGTDEERAADLQQMLDDKEIKAILCARGGYGVSRIVDGLSFKKFRKHPKWIIGFSDITVLHAHLYANFGIATLHAPMAAAFNEGGAREPYVQSLKAALEGERLRYECPAHAFNRPGKAKGDLVGGNLALLAHLVGTPSDLVTKNKILFLEDVGEYLYNIDRMLLQLKRCGRLDELAGLVIGGFTGSKDTTRPFGKEAFELIRDAVQEYGYPVCFGFPVSHERENFALKVGVGYKLDVSEEKVVLGESK